MDGRLVIVSNRLPQSITKRDDDAFEFSASTGGLVTGLKPFFNDERACLWIGWADVDQSSLDPSSRHTLEQQLLERKCAPVFLDADDAAGYYEGLSNSAIWPLFHSFPQIARFDDEDWQAYVRVNERFCDEIVKRAQPGDVFWIHDYHLMLVPKLLRERLPGASIGFFLHIPFPSFETYRMVPWRSELLAGVLGSDLIGFHTYDYARYFLESCTRILGVEEEQGTVRMRNRTATCDAFPLGIDYDDFAATAASETVRALAEDFHRDHGRVGCKLMLSVERLDYSKGIPDRLHAYDALLEQHPEWIGQVVLVLVTVPSREGVGSYQELKKDIDMLVGLINGKYATPAWAPIDYYYRSVSHDMLCSMYRASDIMLVTPLRDGMNLVCKEYLAARDGEDGVLILSELAGASFELTDAVIVNPFNQQELVDAMQCALTMPQAEQGRRNTAMQKRLKRYTSQKWAAEFLDALEQTQLQQEEGRAQKLDETARGLLVDAYKTSGKRAVLLDYDGTLVPFSNDPDDAAPDAELLALLDRLGSDPATDVCVISGRDTATLESWFGATPVGLVAEHGALMYDRHARTWMQTAPFDDRWKRDVRPLMEAFTDRTPASSLEEKECSLVWHYRRCDDSLARRRAIEMKNALARIAEEHDLAIMAGAKIVEVKPNGIDKGSAANLWFCDMSFDFILAIGDDRTDEDMFAAAPEEAWTIKVGCGPTKARFALGSPSEVRELLGALAQ